MIWDILLYVGIFYAGLMVGVVLHMWLVSRVSTSGTIFITKRGDKILYSLELEEPLSELEAQKEVIFKVASELEKEDRS